VARAAAERSNRVKDEFLATVSHELRTPLNAILGWAALLRSEKLSDAAREKAYETLYNSSRAQAQLIEDLLDVSRIITGKLRLEVQPVELAGLIESAVESLRPAAEAKSVRLQMIIDPHAGPISGDPARLQQVLWNLLSNAVKYTPKGGRVYIKLEQVNSHIELSVADTGVGIDPGFLPHVFERFAQEGSASNGRSGLGLGLSIVRSLVEMHGGHVKAESEGQGKGAIFTVSLPRMPLLRQPPAPAKEKREHPSASTSFISIDAAPDLRGLKALVVDDEQDARDLVKEVLELCGAEVKTRGSAAEAFEALQAGGFDILISDIGMPDQDGYALMEKVRSLPGASGIPAVALTAYARVEDRVRALKAGFQTHLPKPIEPIELAAVVASLTGRA
jgi:CheY-like chemotaxis protein/two-component sensor histidine kinase